VIKLKIHIPIVFVLKYNNEAIVRQHCLFGIHVIQKNLILYSLFLKKKNVHFKLYKDVQWKVYSVHSVIYNNVLFMCVNIMFVSVVTIFFTTMFSNV